MRKLKIFENSAAGISSGFAPMSMNDTQVNNEYKIDDTDKNQDINKTKNIFNKINKAQFLNNLLIKEINKKEQ